RSQRSRVGNLRPFCRFLLLFLSLLPAVQSIREYRYHVGVLELSVAVEAVVAQLGDSTLDECLQVRLGPAGLGHLLAGSLPQLSQVCDVFLQNRVQATRDRRGRDDGVGHREMQVRRPAKENFQWAVASGGVGAALQPRSPSLAAADTSECIWGKHPR